MAGSFLYTISKNEPCQVVPPTHLPWHAAYPTPRSFAASLSCQGSLQCFREGKLPGKGVALVEGLATHVFWGILGMPIQRRLTRVAGDTIKRSLNLPAQSLYPAVPTLYSLLLISNVQTRCLVLRSVSVLWTKGKNIILFSLYLGPPGGRGMRAASWFVGYIVEQGETSMKSLTLEGGIKGWAMAGSEHTELMSVMYQCGRSSCLENWSGGYSYPVSFVPITD